MLTVSHTRHPSFRKLGHKHYCNKLKDSLNCEMGMRGTVRCRPTLAYRVYTLTALISATELITRYYSNEKLAPCCFYVRPTSATLADIKPTFGDCAVLAGKALTGNMLWVNCFQIPMVTQPFVSQHKSHIRELVNYFLINIAQVYRVYMIWGLALNAAMCMKCI